MLRWLLRASMLAVMSLVVVPDRAEAGVPIPCTGESLVKVLDIPVLASEEVDARGRTTVSRRDLGYKFSGCTGGEWVVHVGSDSRYIPLSDGQLQLMLLAAGLTEPPPVPSFWSSRQSVPVYIWGFAVGALAIGALFKGRGEQPGAGAAGSAAVDRSTLNRGDAADGDARWSRLAERMEAGASDYRPTDAAPAPASSAPRRATIAPRAATVSPRGGMAAAGAPGFGRRR